MNDVERQIPLERGIQGMWEVCIWFVRGFQDLCKGCIAGGYGRRRRFRFDLKISAGKTCRN